MLFNFTALSLPALFIIMAIAGAVIWYAGSRLTGLVDALAERTGIGQAFAGMLLLGGITSLPEVATASTASAAGNPLLSINDLLGSAAINLTLLAIGDIVYGRAALTSMSARPATLMQGVLGMILLSGVAIVITTGDVALPFIGTGIGATILLLACLQALRVASRFEKARSWRAVDPPDIRAAKPSGIERGKGQLIALILLAAIVILVAGAALAMTGGAIAEKTGLGASIVGFALVGFCTSLPELSTIFAALKLGRHELAIGDIFGTNLFNIQIIFLADLVYSGGPVLNEAGGFEIAAASLAALITGIFVVGLLERRDQTIGRMGTDSALALLVFVVGLLALSRLS